MPEVPQHSTAEPLTLMPADGVPEVPRSMAVKSLTGIQKDGMPEVPQYSTAEQLTLMPTADIPEVPDDLNGRNNYQKMRQSAGHRSCRLMHRLPQLQRRHNAGFQIRQML